MSGVASTGAPAEALSALRADTPPAAAAAAPRSLRDRITIRNDELDAGRPLSRGSVGTECPKPPAAFSPDYFHDPGCSADAPWAFGGRSHPLRLRPFSAQGLDDLVQLLRSTDEVLTEVAGACRAARAALAGLRQRTEQKQGLHPRK